MWLSKITSKIQNVQKKDFPGRYMYKCTMDKQKRQWLLYEGSNGIIISSQFLTTLRTVTGVILWTVHCLGNETNNLKQFSILHVPVPLRSYQFLHNNGPYMFPSHNSKYPQLVKSTSDNPAQHVLPCKA
jgi:hypothetical protein